MKQLLTFLRGTKPKKTPVMTKADRIQLGKDIHRSITQKDIRQMVDDEGVMSGDMARMELNKKQLNSK